MKTSLTINTQTFVLEDFLSPSRTLITIGAESDEAYNVITTGSDTELFQCQLSQKDGGWLLRHGQLRTECPKGIRSRLQHACEMCMGRCVNLRPARPTYSLRYPSVPTLLNGQALPDEGALIHDGDTIDAGGVTIGVISITE